MGASSHDRAEATDVQAEIRSENTRVFPRLLDLAYPNVERGEGVHLYLTDGREILDACSGGAMVACLGHGVRRVIDAAEAQAERIAYVYNHHFTNEAQERLATRLLEVAAPEMARVRFVSGGSEANETALRLARAYHVERGDHERWRFISPAQAYHGATMGTLALSGRPALQRPYGEYLASHLHIPPSTWRFDPTGEAALAELDRLLEQAGPETVAAFFCEPISAAALPAYTPPERFWHGLVARGPARRARRDDGARLRGQGRLRVRSPHAGPGRPPDVERDQLTARGRFSASASSSGTSCPRWRGSASTSPRCTPRRRPGCSS